MGAQSTSAAKGPASSTRQATGDSVRAAERPHQNAQRQIDAVESTTTPAFFSCIPSLLPEEATGPRQQSPHRSTTLSLVTSSGLFTLPGEQPPAPLLLQRKCSTCAKEDEDALQIKRKPSFAAEAMATEAHLTLATPLLLQRKCAACAKEEEEENHALTIQRKALSSSKPRSDSIFLRRKCNSCATEEDNDLHLHRKPALAAMSMHGANAYGSTNRTSPQIEPVATVARSRPEQLVRHAISHSHGEALTPSVRKEMEHAYGVCLSNVRIHVDALANSASQAVAAQAFTLGQSIYFAPGRYQPRTSTGRELLAHELAHVVQNRNSAAPAPSRKRSLHVSDPHDPAELEADAAARAVLEGRTFRVRGSGADALQRKDILDQAIDWGKTTADKAESAAASGIKEIAHFTGEQLMRLVRSVAPGLAAIIDEGPVNFAKRKVSEALDAHLPAALGGFSINDLTKGVSSWLGEAKNFVRDLKNGDEEACKKFSGFMHKMSTFVGKLIDNPVIDAVSGALGKVTDFVTKVLKVVGEPLFDGLKQYVAGAWSALKEVAGTISGWFARAKEALGDVWTQLSSLLGFDGSSEGGVWNWIKGEAGKVWDAIKTTIAPAIEPLKKVASVIALLTPMGQIHAIVKYGPKLVKVAQWIWENGLSPEKIRAAPEEIRGMLESIGGNVNGFKDILKTGLDWLSGKVSSLADAVLDAATRVSGLPILSFAHGLFDAARSELKTIVTDVEKGAEEALASIEATGEKIQNFVKPYKEVISSVILAIAAPPTIPLILAGWAWRALPKCVKAPILDFILDIAIKAIKKIPDLATFGPLWTLLKPAVVGFLETLRAAEDSVKEAVSDKIAKVLSGASPDFLIAFVKGFAQGVWEGITDPLSAIWTVMEGLDKATQYLLSLAGLDDKTLQAKPPASPVTTGAEAENPAPKMAAAAPPQSAATGSAAKPAPTSTVSAAAATAAPASSERSAAKSSTPKDESNVAASATQTQADAATAQDPAQTLDTADLPALQAAAGQAAQEIGPDVDTVKGNFWPAVQDYFNGGSMTFDEMTKRLSETWEAAKAKIAEGGAWLANQLLGFFKGNGAEAELGDKVGWLTGSVVFQVVLDAITAGTWTEADSILVGIAKFINWPMEALGEAFKLLKSLGKFLLDGLKSLGSAIKEAAGGAFKAVSKAVGHIGEKLIEFAERVFGKFGRKAVKAETKAVGALGKEATELGQREASKVASADSAKAFEEKAVAKDSKAPHESEPAVEQKPHAEAATPAETGHIDSDKLTPTQLHNETEMLAEHPGMLEGTPPHRHAQVGEHEWTENPLSSGECEFCRHSANKVCITTPELRAAEMEKAEQRVESARQQASKRTDEAVNARLDAQTHPDLSEGERASYTADLDESTKRSQAARERLSVERRKVTHATKAGNPERLEAAKNEVSKLEAELKNAENDASDARAILGEHEQVLAKADAAEAQTAAAHADLAATEDVAAKQRKLTQELEQKEQEVKRIWAENRQMKPGLDTPQGRELSKAENELNQAREKLTTHIANAQGLTLEIRQTLRKGTPFKGAGGAERYNEWLSHLPPGAKGTGGNYIDYVTGEALPLSSLSPDHIVSVDEIFSMEGFGKLSRGDQLAVLDLKENMAFLERGRNSSKQAQSLTQWLASEKDLAPSLNKARVAELGHVENNARKSVRDEIQRRLERGGLP